MNISDMSKGIVENFIKAFDKDAKNTIETHEHKRAGYKFCAIVCGILVVIYMILCRILPFLTSLSIIGAIFLVGSVACIVLAREETKKIRDKQQAEKEIQEIAEKQEEMIRQTAENLGVDVEEVRKEMYREPSKIWLEQKDQQFQARKEKSLERDKAFREKRSEEIKIRNAVSKQCGSCIHCSHCELKFRNEQINCSGFSPK